MTPQTVYSTEAKPKPPKLLDQVREKLRLKHYWSSPYLTDG